MPRAESSRVKPVLVPVVIALVGLGIGVGFSQGLSNYAVYLGVTVIVSIIAILGLGVVTGSAGMIALCQLTFAAIGAWVVSGLNMIGAPGGYIVWLILGAAAAGLVGILVGLPALRLRGVNLAVVTLGFAAAADVTLVQIQFPGVPTGVSVPRPEIFSDDRGFFLLAVIILVICLLGVYALRRTRWGSSWLFVAFSERGTAAVGASVRTSKLTAFAVSATLGGISGGLVVGQVGMAFPSSFSPIDSLALYVLSIMAGAHMTDMAVFGGLLWVLVPELLKRWGVPQDWGLVIFGVLGIQALTSKTTLGQVIRDSWWKRFGTRPRSMLTSVDAAESAEPPQPGEPLLEVRDLAVTFGEVRALDGVDLTVRENSTVGLIGPNGAGKSTLVDALTGFLPRATGTMTLRGEALRGTPTQRARRGLRRTFQQDRVPPSLTIEAYLRFVAQRRVERAEIDDVLDFFGCPEASTRLSRVDVGTRRVIEVAAQLLSRPAILLLDEPAAGLSHDEHRALADRLTRIPERYGTSLVLIEHDLDMVRSVCGTIVALDFGRVIASGDHAEVLSDPAVMAAYMGEVDDDAADGEADEHTADHDSETERS